MVHTKTCQTRLFTYQTVAYLLPLKRSLLLSDNSLNIDCRSHLDCLKHLCGVTFYKGVVVYQNWTRVDDEPNLKSVLNCIIRYQRTVKSIYLCLLTDLMIY